MKIIRVKTPLSEKEVRKLKVGDIVHLDGRIYTMHDAPHVRATVYFDKKKKLPVDLKNQVICHFTAAYRKIRGKYKFYSWGSTTSARMNDFTPREIYLMGYRGIIGKGGMDKETLKAMKKYGCVYFNIIAGCASLYTKKIVEVTNVYWEDLRSQAIFEVEVRDFGPMLVTMDAHGKNAFEEVYGRMRTRLPQIRERLIKTDIADNLWRKM